MKLVSTPLYWLCWVLDRVPSYEDGHFYRQADWGCRLGLSLYAARLEDRKDA